jgi:amidase
MYYGYTNFGNLLDYTGVTIPVTMADAKVDPYDNAYKPINDLDKQNWEAHDSELYHSVPVGVQVMGRRSKEERMFSISHAVLEAFGVVTEVQCHCVITSERTRASANSR